jgi:GH24 family phage-related lysozyme (muramidase)
MTADDLKLAANVIAHFEGFISRARWDVNAYRLGFGSDTKGATQTIVRPGDVTTWQEAIDNLQARIPKFEAVCRGQVGDAIWASLQPNARAALLSFAYNYGDLTASIVSALMGKTTMIAVANCVAARAVDNHGVNATRRACEAAFIASCEA